MAKRVALTALLATITVAGGVGALADRSSTTSRLPDDMQLVSALTPFEQCDELHAYMRREANGQLARGEYVGRGYGGGGAEEMMADSATTQRATAAAATGSAPSASSVPSADTFSVTNVQEAGIDEPDIVKSDGRRMFVARAGEVAVLDISRPEATVASRIALGDPQGFPEPQLLLAGDRLLVISQTTRQDASPPTPQSTPRGRAPALDDRVGIEPIAPVERVTKVRVVDVRDVKSPQAVAELELDGDHVSSRLVNGVARIVLRSGPGISVFPAQGGRGSSSLPAPVLPETDLDDWLPGYRLSNGAGRVTAQGTLSECGSVRRPQEFSGLDVVSVVSVDPADPRPRDAAAIVGAGDTVYSSRTSLYVSTNAWRAQAMETNLHKYDIADPRAARHVASGTVPGSVLNQFSLSEHDGVLRVATTTNGTGPAAMRPPGTIARGPTSESGVYLLRHSGAELAEIGSVTGLGQGERIYAVRFIGDKGYVVTFRQTDPLYVLDLADPARPVLRGELKVPGYSAYLHPVGKDLLLGVGQDATDQGRVTGTQVSLFDVADPANPTRLSTASIPGARSEVERDHHAFLWWPAERLAVVPVTLSGAFARPGVGMPPATPAVPGLTRVPTSATADAATFRVGDGAVTESGRLSHPDGQPVRRILVSNGRLLTVSGTGVLTSDLTTLAAGPWLGL